MPDKDGKLSEEEETLATEWLRKRAKLSCAACGGANWRVAPYVAAIPADAEKFLGPKKQYPSIVVYCTECGHLRLHSAIMIGILKVDKEEPKKGAENVK